jgi:hypothetical protein
MHILPHERENNNFFLLQVFLKCVRINLSKNFKEVPMGLDDLADKAKDLVGNIPDDLKDKASDVVDDLTEKLPDDIEDKAKDVVDGLKDKLGF